MDGISPSRTISALRPLAIPADAAARCHDPQPTLAHRPLLARSAVWMSATEPFDKEG